MIQYKLALKPPGFEAAITALTIEGRVCCPHSFSKLANNAAFVFHCAHATSLEAEHGANHADCPESSLTDDCAVSDEPKA